MLSSDVDLDENSHKKKRLLGTCIHDNWTTGKHESNCRADCGRREKRIQKPPVIQISSDIERRASMDSPHNLCLWISLLDLHVEWVSEEMLLRGAQCEFSFYRRPRCSIRLCSIGNFERILKSCYIFVFSVPQQRLEIFRMKADNARVSIVNGTYRNNDKIWNSM